MTGRNRMPALQTCPVRDTQNDCEHFRRLGQNRNKSIVCHGQQFIPALFINPDDISPPCLHVKLGLLNQIDQCLLEIFGLELVESEWYIPANVRKSDYQGGAFEGNQCNKLIIAGSKLSEDKTLFAFKPLFDIFASLLEHVLFARCNLSDEDIVDISQYIIEFVSTWQHYETYYISLTEPVKLHILAVHVLEFCIRYRCTPAQFGEQDGESLHHAFNVLYKSVKAQGKNALKFATKKFSACNM
jgi:hypothetical protein